MRGGAWVTAFGWLFADRYLPPGTTPRASLAGLADAGDAAAQNLDVLAVGREFTQFRGPELGRTELSLRNGVERRWRTALECHVPQIRAPRQTAPGSGSRR